RLAPQSERTPYRLLELLDHRPGVRLPQLGEAGMASTALRVPLRGEAAGRDVVHQRAHAAEDVEVIEAAAARELTVLAGRRVEGQRLHQPHPHQPPGVQLPL